MNNPMIILIGLAIAAVGTLVAVNVVLPMLSRAEAQALSSEINTLAGAVWEAKRQNNPDPYKVSNIKHLLSGWTCKRKAPVTGCGSDTKFDNSQVDEGFTLSATAPNITVSLKADSEETCISTASFLRAMNSPFFLVLKEGSTTAEWEGAITDIDDDCDNTPVIRINMK